MGKKRTNPNQDYINTDYFSTNWPRHDIPFSVDCVNDFKTEISENQD